IGDVTGHGVPAALLMAMVKSCLHTQVLSNYRVSDVMEVANNAVFKSTFDRRLMTFFYSILDTKKGILTFANAGHLYPYLFRASTKEVLSLEVSSYPLGVRPNTVYKEESVRVDDGDILVFYSDGIIEAMNALKEEFGFDRLEKIIRESGDRSASEIVKELLLRWRIFVSEGEAQPTEDDVTVVVVKMNASSKEEKVEFSQRKTIPCTPSTAI
ncbi:MAG TPA: PP2C family protein-serine/threonine phosphatase, partial [Chroococcales cyanobacterium]